MYSKTLSMEREATRAIRNHQKDASLRVFWHVAITSIMYETSEEAQCKRNRAHGGETQRQNKTVRSKESRSYKIHSQEIYPE